MLFDAFVLHIPIQVYIAQLYINHCMPYRILELPTTYLRKQVIPEIIKQNKIKSKEIWLFFSKFIEKSMNSSKNFKIMCLVSLKGFYFCEKNINYNFAIFYTFWGLFLALNIKIWNKSVTFSCVLRSVFLIFFYF